MEKSKAKELAEYITEQLAGLEDIRKKPTADTHIEVLSHSISDVKSEVLWRFH